jgi:hypothetical protein
MVRTSDRLRALLVALVLVVQAIMALPTPDPITDRLAKDPAARQQIADWTRAIHAAGIDWSEDEVLARARAVTGALRSTQRALLVPFRPAIRILGLDPEWALFAFPQTHPYQVEVAGRSSAGGPWTVLYLPHRAGFLADQLEYRRVRGVLLPRRGRPPSWDGVVDWIAEETFRRRPEIVEVRVRAIRTRTALPGEELTERPSYRFTESRSR